MIDTGARMLIKLPDEIRPALFLPRARVYNECERYGSDVARSILEAPVNRRISERCEWIANERRVEYRVTRAINSTLARSNGKEDTYLEKKVARITIHFLSFSIKLHSRQFKQLALSNPRSIGQRFLNFH